MAFIKNITLLALLFIGGSESKIRSDSNDLVVHKTHDRKSRHGPTVEGSECSETCLFEDDNNEWCLQGTSNMIKAGWDVYQLVDTTYWLFEFQPYLETQISLTSNFVLQRLVTSSFIMKMNKFKTNLIYSFLFDDRGQVCLGYGYESQAIKLDLTYQFQFVDCYKNLLTDVANPF